MKMSRLANDQTKAKIRQVFQQNTNHWDIEMQQRSCEFLAMMQIQGSQSEFINSAIEKMPSFSQEIQTNNVLTKRILALRAKDGPNLENKMPEKKKIDENNLPQLKYATTQIILPQQSTDLLEMLEAKK